MAPKGRPATKRPATDDGAASLKKQCTAVTSALCKAELPEDVIATLKAAAPFALSTYAPERHAHQNGVVAMVGEALKGIEAGLKKSIEEKSSTVAGTSAAKSSRETAVLTAAKELVALKSKVAQKEFEVYEASMGHTKVQDAYKEKVKAQKSGDKTYNKLAEGQSEFESLKTKVLAMKDGKCELKEVTTLGKDLKAAGVEGSLAESLHLVLCKEATDRSDFDSTILSKLDAELETLTSSWASKVAVEEPGKQERAAATDTAQKAFDASKEALQARKSELSAAQEAVTTGEEALKAAEASHVGFDEEMEGVQVSLDSAQEELTDFESSIIAVFTALQNRTPPPPEPEEAEPAPAAEPVAA
jgi:hypothetical protein